MIHDPNQLTLDVQSDEHFCPSDASISLGLIVTELTINALKHAFPDGRRGRILVSYKCHGPNWTLSVHDDGVGMPSGSEPPAPGLGKGMSRPWLASFTLGCRLRAPARAPGSQSFGPRSVPTDVRDLGPDVRPG